MKSVVSFLSILLCLFSKCGKWLSWNTHSMTPLGAMRTEKSLIQVLLIPASPPPWTLWSYLSRGPQLNSRYYLYWTLVWMLLTSENPKKGFSNPTYKSSKNTILFFIIAQWHHFFSVMKENTPTESSTDWSLCFLAVKYCPNSHAGSQRLTLDKVVLEKELCDCCVGRFTLKLHHLLLTPRFPPNSHTFQKTRK